MRIDPFLRKGLVVSILLLLVSPVLTLTSSCTEEKLPPPSRNNTIQRHKISDIVLVPDCVEIGDIILIDFHVDQSNIWRRPGPYNDHSAIYIGNNTLIEANGIVRYRNYSIFYLWQKNLVFFESEIRDGGAEACCCKLDHKQNRFTISGFL